MELLYWVEPMDRLIADYEACRILPDCSKLPPNAVEYCRKWFTIGTWDFRQGHVVSFLLAQLPHDRFFVTNRQR